MAPVATANPTVERTQFAHADDLGVKGQAAASAAGKAPPAPGAKVTSLANVLTSGQYDIDESVLVPYEDLPKKIEGPTVWSREEYEKPENQEKWVRWWNAEEIQQLEKAASDWVNSGRPHEEIERVSSGAAWAEEGSFASSPSNPLYSRQPSICQWTFRPHSFLSATRFSTVQAFTSSRDSQSSVGPSK